MAESAEAPVVSDISHSDSEESETLTKKRKTSKSISEKVKYDAKFTTPMRKKPKNGYDPVEEARLERLVFGDNADVLSNLLKTDDKPDIKSQNDESEDIVHTDEAEDSEEANDSDEANDSEEANDSDETNDSDEADQIFDSDSEESEGLRAPGIEHGADVDSGFETEDVKRKKVAWVDEDDGSYRVAHGLNLQGNKLPAPRPEKTYVELLRNNYQQLIGTPKWARLEREREIDSDADSDDEILRHSNHLVTPKVKNLPQGTIEMKRLKMLNQKTRTEGPIVSEIQFHPTSTVALVAGLSGILSIFQVDGQENTKLHSMQYHKFPIRTARFIKEGSEIIVGSHKHNHAHAYDLIAGRTYKIPLPHEMTNMKKFEVSPDGKFIAVGGRMGDIYLLTSGSKELAGKFKMNAKCNSLAFTPDSSKLVTHGEGGEMYIWDMKERTCMHRAMDDGCLTGTKIAVSPSGQYLATGSQQGVVNIYDYNTVLETKTPQPSKIILNLVTSITNLKFNPTSEILAMSSEHKENACKLLHFPSATIFSNFPSFQTKLSNPIAINFSPGSGYMGISNNRGKAFLYRLKHYGNY